MRKMLRRLMAHITQNVVVKLTVVFGLAGLAIGAVFPVIADLLVVWKPGARPWFVASCVTAGILVAAFNVWMVKRLLIRRLVNVDAMAKAIDEKNLSVRCKLRGNDIVGHIANSMNRMADSLHQSFSQMQNFSGQLAAAADTIGQIRADTDRCLGEQKDYANRATEAVTTLNTAVEEVTSSAAEACDASTDANKEANNGALVATEAIGGSDALVEKIAEASSVVEGLSADSENIGVVLDVIRGIAEQTNLLALNAAIEAARAGEQGRGFAVVADEVRTLAGRTQQSTQEIQNMIEQLQSNVSMSVKVIAEARGKGEEGTDQVEKTAEALGGIAASVSSMQSMNGRIADAAAQQRSASGEINDAVEHIRNATANTAAGRERVVAVSEELGGLAQQLDGMLQQYKF